MAARTAVVAGTATAVSGSVQRHSAQKAADKQQAQEDQQAPMQAEEPAPPAAAPAGPDRLTKLKELGDLKATGVLNDAEFEAEKARILAT